MATRAWRPGRKRWEIAPASDETEPLGRQLGVSTLVAQVLHNRGVRSVEEGKAFLSPKLADLHDPLLLPQMETAAARIAQAVAGRQRVVIYGDYDVDGMTAVAILHACLKLLGADVHYYVPHRLEEGYGVHAAAIRKIVAEGAKLLITVDCGVSDSAALAEATAAGVDVIVTDHHTPPAQLPAVLAVVHPNLSAENFATKYPNPDLSGAGVALKLAWQISRQVLGQQKADGPMRDFLLNATSLAAMGTIADVVPLRGENRALATYGLQSLPLSKHDGVRALLESADLAGKKLDAYHVAFVLGPRLNACGRMGHARLAVELLTDAPYERCRKIANGLAKQNVERQKVEREIADQAAEMVVARGMDKPDSRAIVLASDQWHGGVIGIVASRMVERFSRPTFLIAISPDGCGHGSARSIPGFHLCDALKACSQHLLSFGGHAMAGGLRIEPAKIDAFAAAMQQYARGQIIPDQLTPLLRIDAETTLAALTFNAVRDLGRLAPFGQGNPPPMIAVAPCQLLAAPRRMGQSGRAVSLFLGQNGASIRAVGFGMGDLADLLAGVKEVRVAAEPTLNSFNGRTNVELKLADVAWGGSVGRAT